MAGVYKSHQYLSTHIQYCRNCTVSKWGDDENGVIWSQNFFCCDFTEPAKNELTVTHDISRSTLNHILGLWQQLPQMKSNNFYSFHLSTWSLNRSWQHFHLCPRRFKRNANSLCSAQLHSVHEGALAHFYADFPHVFTSYLRSDQIGRGNGCT